MEEELEVLVLEQLEKMVEVQFMEEAEAEVEVIFQLVMGVMMEEQVVQVIPIQLGVGA